MLPFSIQILSRTAPAILLIAASLALTFTGCRQPGSAGGFAGAAPITQLPGQTAMTGPALPSLGPFGASTRVPPPATGSYGSGVSAANAATYNPANNYAPAGYQPSGLVPMSYEASGSGQVANAGGNASLGGSAFGSTAIGSSAIGNSQASSGWNAMGNAGTSWTETSAQNPDNYGTQPPYLSPNSGLRSGGMPVIDLTGSAPPPGYRPSYAPTSPPNQAPSRVPNQTISGGGFATSAPAANQPAFSTANQPLQWQAPRR